MNYYVSTTGNNSNDGLSPSDLNAWQTITYAVSQVSAGDTVYVLDGDYHENVLIEKDGLAGNFISIKAHDYSNKPRIIAASNLAVLRLRGSYLNISGLRYNTSYAQSHISVETGNHIILEKNEINGNGYLGLHGISVTSALADDVVIRYNKFKNIEGIPLNISCSGAEIYYNLVDGYLTNAITQNIQLYIYHDGNFNIYNNTFVGGRCYGIYLANTGITGNIKNNIIAYYGIRNNNSYGLWINPLANVTYDYNIITCSCINPQLTTSGGTDGGHNFVGSSYFPNFKSLRNKGKFLIYNDDYLDKMEICAAIANYYLLSTVGALIYTYNNAEENLISRINSLYSSGNEIVSHTTSHQSLNGEIDEAAEIDWMRTWLSSNISGYDANTIVYPGGLISTDSINYLNNNGYSAGRIGSSTSSTDLRTIDIFQIPVGSIASFVGDRNETNVKNFIKQHAQALACSPSISGILTHTFSASDPTEEEFGWICEALSECLDYVDIPTLTELAEELRNSGNWSSLDGKHWERTNYLDNSDYSLKIDSIAVHSGVNVGLSVDIDGAAIVGTPSIGSYEYIEEDTIVTEYYVTPTGAGAHNGISEANAWNLAEALIAINAGTVVVNSRVNLKNSGTYTTGDWAVTQNGTTYAWKVLEGYSSIPGDGGIAYILRNAGSSHLINFNGRTFWKLKNLKVNGNNSGAVNVIVGSQCTVENVESYNAGTVGIYGDPMTKVLNCVSHNNGTDGFYDGSLYACLAYSNTQRGISQVTDKCTTVDCISKGNGQHNFAVLKGTVIHCISDGGSQAGFYTYYNATLINCMAVNHTSGAYYALHFFDITGDIPANLVKNFNFYNNVGLGNCNKLSYIATYTSINPQFSNTSVYDYRRLTADLNGIGYSDLGLVGVNYRRDVGIGRELPTYAAITDVRSGIDRGDGTSGTLDLPSINDVQEGVTFDNTTKIGVFGSPIESNVKLSISYGANNTEFTGSYAADFPSENDVQDGVLFDEGNKEGNLTLPVITDVKNLIQYGANGIEFIGSYIPDFPSEDDVRDGVLFNEGGYEGNLLLPAIIDVRELTQYGTNGVELTGDLDLPSINDVQDGVSFDGVTKIGVFGAPLESYVLNGIGYGANDTEFIGNRTDADEEKVLESESYGANGNAKTGVYHETAIGEVRVGVTYGASHGLTGTLALLTESYPISVKINNDTGDLVQLNLVQKEKLTLTFTVTDEDGTAIDLSTSTFTLYIKSLISSTTPLVTKNNTDFTVTQAANGIISVVLTDTNLNFNGYAYGILKINTGNSIDKTYFRLHLTESAE